uniref:Carbohydrate-binding module family 19 domain-containing protein n=1 Tax=Coptotermes formosanus TaxID=36987 RepID=R4UM98_COPFO|nr:hypothetical protein [Coptotermes formosanus]
MGTTVIHSTKYYFCITSRNIGCSSHTYIMGAVTRIVLLMFLAAVLQSVSGFTIDKYEDPQSKFHYYVNSDGRDTFTRQSCPRCKFYNSRSKECERLTRPLPDSYIMKVAPEDCNRAFGFYCNAYERYTYCNAGRTIAENTSCPRGTLCIRNNYMAPPCLDASLALWDSDEDLI